MYFILSLYRSFISNMKFNLYRSPFLEYLNYFGFYSYPFSSSLPAKPKRMMNLWNFMTLMKVFCNMFYHKTIVEAEGLKYREPAREDLPNEFETPLENDSRSSTEEVCFAFHFNKIFVDFSQLLMTLNPMMKNLRDTFLEQKLCLRNQLLAMRNHSLKWLM